MTDQPLLQADGLTRRFGAVTAVAEAGLGLQRGEIVGLLGPNGAGKTTTLRMLTGDLAPTTGRIRIGGADLQGAPKAAKRQVGFLPEEPPLIPELSVDAYLDYCARLRGLTSRSVQPARERVKAQCGLEAMGRRVLGNLSKGYRQRVGIAQALVHDPALVVLDEPTVALDPIQILEIRELIRGLAGERGVILSTHLLPEVEAICTRVIIMVRGHMVLDEALATMRRRQPSAIRMRLGGCPTAEEVQALPGVASAEPMASWDEAGPQWWRLALAHPGVDLEPILRAALDRGWGPQALVPEAPTLEQLFIDLVHGRGSEGVAVPASVVASEAPPKPEAAHPLAEQWPARRAGSNS